MDALRASLSEVAPKTCSGLLAFVRVSIGGGRIGRAGIEAVEDWDEVDDVRWGVEQSDEDDEWIGVSESADGGDGLSAGRRWEACGEAARARGIPGGALLGGRGGDSVEVILTGWNGEQGRQRSA